MMSAGEVQESQELARALYELQELAQTINTNAPGFSNVAGSYNASIESQIERWIAKVRAIARQFRALDYSISVGIPSGVSASFSWSPGADRQDDLMIR